MEYELKKIKTISADNEGSLSFFEAKRDIPFDIKRVYYIHGANAGVVRGGHAHKALFQFIICVYGKIRFQLDDGKRKEEIILDSPGKGIYIKPGLWRDMIWEQDDSVLCVFASEYYDETDYIRDYKLFIEWKEKQNECN